MNVTSYDEPEPPMAKVLGKRALVYLGILVFALALLLILNTGNASAAGPTYVWQDITTDTTWDEANSPYIVNQSIAIDPGVTLTIDPNVTVMFDNGVWLTVSGALDAQGTADEPVTFTSNGSTVWGAWDGLYFDETSTGSVLDYVVIEYAYYAIYVYNSDVALSNAEISWSSEAAVWWFVDDGDLEASMSNVRVNGSDWLGIIFYNVDGSNDLTLSGIEVVNANYGIVCDANVNAVLSYTDIYTNTIWNDALWIGTTFGDVDALIDMAMLEYTMDNAIYVEVDEGAATLAFTDLWIDYTDEQGIYVFANGTVDLTIDPTFVNDTWWQSMYVFSANGDLNIDISDTMFSEVWNGYSLDFRAANGAATVSFTGCAWVNTPDDAIEVIAAQDVEVNMFECAFYNVNGDLLYAESIEGGAVVNAYRVLGEEFWGGDAFDVQCNNTLEFYASYIMLNDTWWTAFELDSWNGDIILVVDFVEVNNAQDVFVLNAPNGVVDATIEYVLADGLSGYYLYQYAPLMTDAVIEFNNILVNDAAYVIPDVIVPGDIELILFNSSFTNIYSDCFWMFSTDGNITVDVTDSIISVVYGTGIYAYAPNGWVSVTVDPSVIDGCWYGIFVDALWIPTFDLTDTTISNCYIGVLLYADIEDLPIFIVDCVFDGNGDFALNAYANLGNITFDMVGTLVNDTGWIGIYLESFSGDVVAVLYQSTFALNGYESIELNTMQYDVDLLIDECLFDGDYQDSVVVWAADDAFVEITDTVMDGSASSATSWYFFEEIEYEFEIIDPDVWSTGGFWYTLSFDFPFGGSTYNDILVAPDGYIWVDGNMIWACQDWLIADGYPGVGVKEYEDRLVVQWDVYNYWDWYYGYDTYLRNVFEVILYDNGDIQFNYAEMESFYNGAYFYGIDWWFGDIDLQDLYNYNAFDNDFSSVYLTYEPMSWGAAVEVTSVNNCTALVTGNEVSNYAYMGMGFLAEDGWMWLDATNNSFSNILGGDYGALTAMAWSNTIWANVENNVFSYLPFAGVVLMSAPLLGGEDVFNVVENEFLEVGWVSIAAVSQIYDNFNESDVTYVSTRTITDNVGINSGVILTMTMISSSDSAWNITLDDMITGNEFTGTPKYYDSFIGFALQPEFTGISAILEVELATGNSTIAHNAVITDNIVPQNIFGFGIIAMDEIYLESGNVESTSEFTITDNIIDTGLFYYEVGILSYVDVYFTDGNAVSTVLMDIQRNTILTENYGGAGIIVGTFMYEWGYPAEQFAGDGTMDIEVWIWDNTVENFSLGIGGEFGIDLYNCWGDFVVDLAVSVMFNDVSATYEGIMFEVWSVCEFYDYFSPFETEITSSVTTNIDFIIEENVVETWNSGIGVRIQSWAAEDAYGVFTNAIVDTNAVVNINDNMVLEAEGMVILPPSGPGIGVENFVEAYGGEAQAMSSLDVVMEGNTVSLYDVDPGIGVRDYVGAYTNPMELDDAPTATSEITATIAFNTVENAYNGIALGQESDAENGMSFADSTFTALVFDNTVTGATYHGIYADCEADTYQDYGYGAVASLITDVTIEDNLVDEVWDEGIYVDFEADSYSMVDSTFDILDNTIIGVEEMVMTGCDGVTVDGDYVAVFNIIGNVIDNFEGGIWAWDASVLIEGNTITNTGYGIDLESVWGVVESNVMTDVYNAFYLYECWDLVVVDNMATTSFGYDSWDGVDVYYCWNLTFEANYIEGFAYGMYIYDTWESVFTGNSVIDSVWDAVEIYYCDWIEFSYNTVVGSQDDGLYVYYSPWITIEGNTISDCMDDGIDIYESDNAVISNNIITNVGDDGLEADYCYDLVLYNGVFADCADYGIDAYYYGMVWIVDGVAEVRNCPVYFGGDVTIVDGGILTTDFVSSFYLSNDWYDGVPALTVEEGGTLVATNTAFGGWWEDLNGDAWLFDVYGTLTMDNSWIYGAYQLYCGPTSDVEIHASVIAWNYLNGVFIDDCSPIIASTEITDNEKDGVFITGENAEPSIKDCTIAFNERGIYAFEASLGQVIDNLIFYNYMAGIYVDSVVGEIHDNILLFNQREIFVQNSVLSIEDNQIGYSMYVELMAEYWPILMGEMGLGDSPMQWFFDPEDIMSMMSNHIGVYVDGSVVECSGNVYGMLSYALYAVESEVLFADSVEMNTLVITYFDEWYTMYNISLPIFVFDGIFASDSMIDVVDAYIEVMDDAVFLEACEAWIENSEFVAGDFDIYAMDNTTADVLSTDVDKVKAEDTSTINMWFMLTIYTVDPDGNPVDVPVLVFNAVDTFPIYEGNSSGGVFAVPVIAGQWTSSGEDTSMNPYTAYASFEDGNVDQTVTVDGPTEVTLQDPGPPTLDVSLGFVLALVFLAGILVFIGILTLAARP